MFANQKVRQSAIWIFRYIAPNNTHSVACTFNVQRRRRGTCSVHID